MQQVKHNSLYSIFSFVQLIFPTDCIVCGKRSSAKICTNCFPRFEIVNSRFRCKTCFSEICSTEASQVLYNETICEHCSNFPPAFKKLRYIWNYDFRVKAPITYMKYHPSEQMLNELSGGMAKLYAELFSNESFDLIIPIPATTSSLRSRLFHVTEFLAKKIKQKNGLKTKIESRALRFKNSKRTPQASLTRRQRLINAKNCFEANKELVEGKNILLIEDVITTGATVNSALQELFKKNAKSVSIYCLAKSKERRLISFS